jgi:hypothetical protein
MKAFIIKILKAVPARTGKPLSPKYDGQNKSPAFQPAPSYWALIPARVEASVPPEQKKSIE